MEKEKKYASELAKNIKKKNIRKYVLLALSAVIVFSAVIGLNLEDKDSKLPDGRGNIINNEQSIDDKDEVYVDTDSKNDDVVQSDDDKEDDKTGSTSGDKSSINNNSSTNKNDTPSGKKPTSEDIKVDNSDDFTASNDGNVSLKPDEEQNVTVTISIKCTTLSSDMSKLTNQAIAPYVPSNGVILSTTAYRGTTENTVFDVINTVCRNNGIQIEYEHVPMFETYYIRGINYLYDKDAGFASGWMYKVNGWFPNYGVSNYYLSDGDVIEFVYTCDGGPDVGDYYMG